MLGVAGPFVSRRGIVSLSGAAAGLAVAALWAFEARDARTEATLELAFVVDNENIDPDGGVDEFIVTEQQIERCYRASLPENVDPDAHQGTMHVAVHVDDDGYGDEVRLRGDPMTLDAFAPCFEAALKGRRYGEPYGQPAGFLGVYRLELGDDAPERRHRRPPPTQRVYPSVVGLDDSGEAIGYLFLLLRRDPIERCYDAFLEEATLSGDVDIAVSKTRLGRVKIRTAATDRRLNSVAQCIEAEVRRWTMPYSLVNGRRAFTFQYALSAEPAPRPRPQRRARSAG
ncbi:MAG: hypothetical protein AAGA54_34750 [Myxococcota bacterium]